jgi:hypothetical protein
VTGGRADNYGVNGQLPPTRGYGMNGVLALLQRGWDSMLIRTSPVRVVWRGTYSQESDQGDNRIAYKSGKLVEHCKLIDETTGDLLDWTVAEHVNGEVQVGGVYELEAEQRTEQTTGHSRTGREYVATKIKHKIVGAKSVKAQPVATAA